jgi:hypothetical protein
MGILIEVNGQQLRQNVMNEVIDKLLHCAQTA